MKKRNQTLSLIGRGLLVVFALCSTIVIYFSSNTVMRTIKSEPQQNVVVAQLMSVRPGGMPQLRTDTGRVVYWEASLQELAQVCADGLPFELQGYELFGGLYYYSVSAKIGWIVFSFSLFLVTLFPIFWPLKKTSVHPVAMLSSKNSLALGVHVKEEIAFAKNLEERRKRMAAQLAVQFCCALSFIIIITLSWGWFWTLLLLIIPILVTTLWVVAQSLLIRGLGILLLITSVFLGKVFIQNLTWRDLIAITANPYYVQTHVVPSQSGRQKGVATTERQVNVFFSYEWQDATRYGYISLSENRMMDQPLIDQLQTGTFTLFRDRSPTGRFLTSSTGQMIAQLVSGLGFCFCFVCGCLMLLHKKSTCLRQRGKPDKERV